MYNQELYVCDTKIVTGLYKCGIEYSKDQISYLVYDQRNKRWSVNVFCTYIKPCYVKKKYGNEEGIFN